MTGAPPLSSSVLEGFRSALTLEHTRSVRQIDALTAQFDDLVASSAFASTDDEHDPDGSTIAFERAKVAALLDQARRHLAEVESALDRIDLGTFGLCENCGAAIGFERLQARPRARLCFACAQAG